MTYAHIEEGEKAGFIKVMRGEVEIRGEHHRCTMRSGDLSCLQNDLSVTGGEAFAMAEVTAGNQNAAWLDDVGPRDRESAWRELGRNVERESVELGEAVRRLNEDPASS